MFYLRFDMRGATGDGAGDLYRAALEMAEWTETRGCLSIVISEHHASEDGYLPSPMLLATAVAARTSSVPITVAALILPFYDPIRLAEEMAVLDVLSDGRVSYVAALGYREEEYEHFGVPFRTRGSVADRKLPVLLAAKSGGPVDVDGRVVRITPGPLTSGGPEVAWGGGSVAAARRAGRHGISFFAQKGGAELQTAYEEAAREAGVHPATCMLPPPDLPTTVFVAEDVDRAWDEIGPYLVADARAYAAWNEGDEGTASISFATTVEELRAESGSYRVLSVDEAVEFVRAGNILPLHPLTAGIPPELAWPYLRTVVDQVVPATAG